ncbi:hypothetical protein CBER1_04482 [Cercospora berteroae]|uniref:F-box domain-containing protein n=1 Tax=Cercospora berteroae TaxID=357750 RepID=A0A2S6CF20_9PEZI|nr:hypothetical protein CBER1_04482 [Cercospora berteroae]
MAPPPSTPPPPSSLPTKPSPLAIPELLENIILHLPLRDVLLCQRVDTKFRDVVQGSNTIRKVLFLEPATNKTVEFCEVSASELYSGPLTEGYLVRIWKISEAIQEICPLLNPFMVSLFETAQRKWNWAVLDEPIEIDRTGGCYDDAKSNFTRSEDPNHPRLDSSYCRALDTAEDSSTAAINASVGSLPHMLVTHPPCSKILVYYDWTMFNTYATAAPKKRLGPGVRFRTLVRAAGSMAGMHALLKKSARRGQKHARGVTVEGADKCRVLPASALNHVTGWEMLTVMNSMSSEDMNKEIDRIITARKKWYHVVDEASQGAEERKESFARESEP